MLIRRLVMLIGLLTAVAGLLQIITPQRVEAFAKAVLGGNLLYVFAVAVVALGAVLVAGGMSKHIRVRRFVLLLGLLMILSGVFMIAAPTFARELADVLYFNRCASYRMITTWAGGILRIVFGLLLVYAGWKAPTPRTPRLGSIVPIA